MWRSCKTFLQGKAEIVEARSPRLFRRWEHSHKEEKEKIIRYLDHLPNGDQLCHGDFHPGNVLVGEEKGVIDWMTGVSGNPAGDAARTLILFRLGTMPSCAPKSVKALINLIRNKMEKEYMKYYLNIAPITYLEIDKWILPVAAARLVEWIPKEEKDHLTMVVKERLKAMN